MKNAGESDDAIPIQIEWCLLPTFTTWVKHEILNVYIKIVDWNMSGFSFLLSLDY